MKLFYTKQMPSVYKNSTKGFALVTAIFLLLTLSALGAMMVTFFTAQQQNFAEDILGSRAYQAARAGIEWAALGVTNTYNTAPGTLWLGCATGLTIPLNQMSGNLAPFTVTVTCTSTKTSQGYVYLITSVSSGLNGAALGTTPDYVSRTINSRMDD